MNIARLLLLLPLLGFVPYDHEGFAVLPIDGEPAQGRALFSSEVSTHDVGVLVRATLTLADGAQAYVVIDMALGAVGQEVPAKWTYYEKIDAEHVRFEATHIDGHVVIADRYEWQDETSLRLDIDATLIGNGEKRTIINGSVVTAPSPAVLRHQGAVPTGVVVVDDGSGARVARRGYPRGDLSCAGEAETTVVLSHDDGYYDQYGYYDEWEYVDDGSTDEVPYPDDGATDLPDDGVTDDAPWYDDPAPDDGYDDSYDDPYADSSAWDTPASSSSDATPDCSGSDTTTESSSTSSESSPGCGSSDSSSSSSSSGGGLDCEGDAVAAGPAWRAPQRPPAGRLLARRVVTLSPMLLAILIIMALRTRRSA